MSSTNNYPPGGPPPFGPPPTSTSNSNNNNNNNNAAPATESPSSVDSEIFADIDVIICGIKDDVGALLSSLQQYARKRSDGASAGLSAALDVRFHLVGQQDLDGCVRFVRTHGREMQEEARRVFGGDAVKWKEDEMESEAGENEDGEREEEGGDGEGEEGVGGEEEMLVVESELNAEEEHGEDSVASKEDTARVQWMEAHEAMEVAQRLQTLQDDILRDIPLLSEEERAHKVGSLWHQVHGDHWYEVVEARLKGEKFFG